MKHALFLTAFLSTFCVRAQVLDTQWLRTAGGFSQFEVYRSAADGTGHIYTAGLGVGMDFGSGVLVPTEGRVIARYDSTGTITWARALTTTANELATISAIAVTSEGDLWVSGYFLSATLTLDNHVLNNPPSTTSAFLARFDSTGTVENALGWGGASASVTSALDVCVDDLDNVRVTGATDAPGFTVGGLTLTNTTPYRQVFTLALDAVGSGHWGMISNAPLGGSHGITIATDALDNTYVVAGTTGVFIMDGDTVDTGFLTQAVLIKHDAWTGTVEYIEVLAECQPLDLTVDAVGNAYVCGTFDTQTIFNSDTLVPSVLDGFVAAYANDGSYRWVVGVSGAIDNEICSSVDLDAAGTGIVVGGTFVFDAWFGGLHMVTGTSPTDGFLMQLDTTGTVNWVSDMTGDGPTLFAEARLDPWDHLYASGVTQSATTYLGEPVLNGSGNHAFLARFGDFATVVPNAARAIDLHLYPNPSNGSFMIDLPAGARTVIIEDVLGRVIQRVTAPKSRPATFRIGIPGSYFVTVLTDAGRAVQRLNVE